MTEIKLYRSTIKGLKIIAMSIPFVLIGIWMIGKEPFETLDYIMGWIGICFSGLGISIGIFIIFDKRPQIIIDENGVWDRRTKQDKIIWEQIIEAYPLNIYNQKFISIVTDETFELKKKQYKWATKINTKIGAQQLNLNIGQTDIDVNILTELINNLSKAKKEDRKKIIQSFHIDHISLSTTDFLKVLIYISISIALLLLSLTGLTAFMTIMIASGIAALIARWFSGSSNNSKILKYTKIITWFGFINLVLCLFTIKSYEYISDNVGHKISTELEIYKNHYYNYPSNLNSINTNLNFNIFEKYIVNKIEYKSTIADYELSTTNLFNKRKLYDRQLEEWN